MEIASSDDARKRKIEADEAWEMIRGFKKVIIGRGKSYKSFVPEEENREEILKAAMGRSGNLRAPAMGRGDLMVIGFNMDMYSEFLG